MPSRPNFNLRLRAYTPLGAPGAVIPDQGITITSAPDGPTLQATISTTTYQALPHDLEIAVEVFDDVANAWVEGRDCRLVVTQQQGDERDVTLTTTLSGVGLMQWLMGKAALAGVTPLQASGNVEAAASTTTASVRGSTFTWGSNSPLGTGDRIRITNSGKAKGLSSSSVYYVRNPGTSTFQVSQTPTGAIKSFGSSNSVGIERVRTRIVFTGSQPFSKNQAISVWDANANQNLTNGSRYYVVNPTGATIQVATKPGGIPIELVADSVTIYRYLDGARAFTSETPGQIIGDPFLEARARGWGQDASGTDQVFHSWTNAGDSNSLAWPARVDDPTITGATVSFQPGTSLWAMTTFLLDNGWAEFASHGRTLDLFAPLTGQDYSSTRRIGGAATSVPKTVDLTNYATSETVRGDGPVEVTAKVARSPWGVLEVYSTASGIGSSSAAKAYGNTDLAKNQSASVGWVVTEQASAAAWLPILDYQRGDWVSAQVEGSSQKLRVIQWSITKATDGTVAVSATLQAKVQQLLKKVAKAARAANGGRALTTTSTTPHESDARKAAVPANLTVVARSTSAADRSAAGTLTASWAAVTSDENGNDLTGARYELTVRPDGAMQGSVVTTTTALSADLPALPAGQTVAVSVRAISNTGAYGEASPEVEYVVDLPPVIPDPPTAPAVSSTLGSITIAWDGQLVDAIDGPHAPAVDDSLAYVAVQRSTDQQTWTTEAQTLNAAGSVVDLGLTVGTAYFYRLVAVSQLGIVSSPSPVNSATVIGVDTAQIDAAFTQQVSQAASTASNAQTVADQSSATAGQALTAAQNASTAASNAQTTANGKNTVRYSTSAPSGNGTSIGDLWFQVDGSGHIIGQWTWAGATPAWTPNLISGSVLTNLDAGSITVGTLSAARIAARSLSASQLAVADFTNLWPSPHLDATGGGPQFTLGGNVTAYAGTDVPVGNAIVLAGRDHVAAVTFPTKAGDSFYIEYTLKSVGTANVGCTPALWLTKANGYDGGSDTPAWAASSLIPLVAVATVQDLGGGWGRYSGKFTIPSTWTNVANAALYFHIGQPEGTAGSTQYAIGDVLVRRTANATLIVDGSISTTQLNATAIDGMTITGATFRTASTAKTAGGVQLDSTGLHGYNAAGSATFSLDTAGNLSLVGTIAGGSLTVGSGGTIVAGSATLSTAGLAVTPVQSVQAVYGQYVDADATFYGTSFNIDPSGGSNRQATYSHLGVTANGGQMTVRSGGALTLKAWWSGTGSSSGMADFNLGNDGTPRVWSNAIAGRVYGGASTLVGTSSTTGLAVITNAGTIGVLSVASALFMPDVYGRTGIVGRTIVIRSDGAMGYSSSSRRTKNLHQHLRMDDAALEKWLELPTWEFEYKPELKVAGTHHGLVAEEVEAAGFTQLVYYDEREGETFGQVDGLAYERMGVYNHMALKRLYARLVAAEEKLAALTGKA